MIDILQKAAKNAGRVILDYFLTEISVFHKTSHHNLVTKADFASQKIICQTIIKLMQARGYRKSQIGLIGEENLNIKGKYQFIIDPLDGTTNFASGIDYFAISIGLLKDGKSIAGVVYNPISNVFYIAEKNKGAYKIIDKKILKLSYKFKKLQNCILATYFTSDRKLRKKQLKIIEKIFPKFRGLRASGSVVLDLCRSAENTLNIIMDIHCSIWDFAAAKLIVNEAGGKLTDWQGQEIDYDLKNPEKTYQILASHPKNIPIITNLLS